jgi:hypothetical protein
MTDVAINGGSSPSNSNAFSGWGKVWSNANLPLPRPMHDGTRHLAVYRVLMYGGSGGNIRLFAANGDGGAEVSTGEFGSAAAPNSTGWRSLTKYFPNVTSTHVVRLGFIHGGTLYYGRHTSSGDEVRSNGGLEWSGASLSGQFSIIEGPSAPSVGTITQLSNGETRIPISAPSDNGGSTIYTYRHQIAKNSSFSSGLVQFDSPASNTDVDLAPGTYYHRVAARTSFTDYYGRYGQWSSTKSFTVKARGKRWNGSSFTGLTIGRRWNGSSWVDLTTMKRWNGTSWVDLST